MSHKNESSASMSSSNNPPRATAAPHGMEGNLGIMYVFGEQTGGKITVVDSVLGRKMRGICGAYDRFAALVDNWELEWPLSRSEYDTAESQLISKGLKDVKIHHVAVGKNHRVALSLDGQLFSWGRPGIVLPNSELGHKHGISFKATATGIPHRVITASELFFTQVSCGKHHSVAITNNGDIYTWGRNFEGQLGHMFTTLPKEVNTVLHGVCAWPKYVSFFLGKPRVVSACCGDTFTVVLLTDGSIYLLGGSSLRPVSNTPKNSVNLILEKGSNGEPFVDIACGSDHLLAITSAGEMYSWGLNTFGQLGHGVEAGRGEAQVKGAKTFPNPVVCDNSITWAKVYAGGCYSAAITTEHELYTWGNGSHGKLGHGMNLDNLHCQDCEFVPRRIDSLRHIVVGSVVCTHRNLFAFAPTFISEVIPICGEHTGGYELRICGSGFWSSDNVTVRFVPLTDGRLLRGTLGTFSETRGEIVCQVPKFRLSGEYAVEVSMNGKQFTSNGRRFTVFKRPQVALVSVYDARYEGGEELTLSLCGNLPEICQRPVVRFIRCCVDGSSEQVVIMKKKNAEVAASAAGVFDERPESVDEEKTEHDPSDMTGRLLRLVLPAFPTNGEGLTPFRLEISYDGGLMFAPVCVDPSLTRQKDTADEDEEHLVEHNSHLQHKQEDSQPVLPHVVWVHDAQLVRVSPNSFLTTDLPQTITLELQNLLPPEVAQLLVTIVYVPPGNDMTETLNTPNASASLSIDRVEGNVITCTIPVMTEWCTHTKNSKTQSLSAEWWKSYTKTGFMTQLRVSMNSGRTFLPAQLQLGGRSSVTAAQVFGGFTLGRLLSLFPTVGMVTGGTQVSVAGDFFHFDSQDATVKLQWRESSVVVPAICLRPDESARYSEVNSNTRRVVFRTPVLPFPISSAAMIEGMIIGMREEVTVFVSLDGEHFTEAGLRFMYCAAPEMNGISPQEAQPGTKMVLAVDKVIASSAACVRLETAESKLSLVIPVEIDEEAHTAEFMLPHLPINADELVHVSLSLNGQEFTEEGTADPMPEPNRVSFLYNIPALE